MIDVRRLAQGRRLAHGHGRRVRLAAGVSLRELASAVGVDATTLFRWEKGETAPRTAAALRWAEAIAELRRGLDDLDDTA
jgi:transcriptional regulator with XRE-family HTH domain